MYLCTLLSVNSFFVCVSRRRLEKVNVFFFTIFNVMCFGTSVKIVEMLKSSLNNLVGFFLVMIIFLASEIGPGQ